MDGQPAADSTFHLGLDLGGTNLKWVVVERGGDEWQVRASGQVASHTAGGPDTVVAQLASVATEVARTWPGIVTVGIGVPGLYDPAVGTIRFLPNVPGDWAGRPVAGPVGAALGVPAWLINDARAFGVAELRLGAGRGASSMIGLTLGTGVGGAVAIGGRIHQGHDGTAGELGHQTIDPDGPICGCGNRGCLEAYARADQIALRCGTATVEEAVLAGNAGDSRAIEGLAETGRYLGIGIANAVVTLTPDIVILGGGVAGAGDLLIEPLWAELRRRVHITSLDRLRIATAALGVLAGAIGAAIHAAEMAEAGVAIDAGAGAGRRADGDRW